MAATAKCEKNLAFIFVCINVYKTGLSLSKAYFVGRAGRVVDFGGYRLGNGPLVPHMAAGDATPDMEFNVLTRLDGYGSIQREDHREPRKHVWAVTIWMNA